MKPLSRCAILCWLAAPAWSGGPFPFEDLDALTGHLRSGGPPVDGIPAVTNPDFGPASEIDYVAETDLVIGVARGGEVKAYPENLGWWHEIINDRIGDGFISVTLCPLTGTPQVFDATAEDGTQIEFGVSGLLINSNLVMYDRRDDTTLYPQMIYTGINGAYMGEQLELLPAIVTTFEMWKRMYPDSEVALSGTGLDRYPQGKQSRYSKSGLFRDYPYGDYRTDQGGAKRSEQPGQTAQGDKLGQKTAQQSFLASTQGADDGGFVTALIHGRLNGGYQNDHAGNQGKSENVLDPEHGSFHDLADLGKQCIDIENGDAGKAADQIDQLWALSRRQVKAADEGCRIRAQ